MTYALNSKYNSVSKAFFEVNTKQYEKCVKNSYFILKHKYSNPA